MGDYADFLSVPQIAAVASGQAVVTAAGGSATIVSVSASQAIRLWALDLSCWNSNTGTAINAAALVGGSVIALCWAGSAPSGGTAVGNKFTGFGGIVLPRGQSLTLNLNGGVGANQEAYAAALYTLA